MNRKEHRGKRITSSTLGLTGSTGRFLCLLLMVVAPIVAMPSVAAASSEPAAGSNANCVCGPKQVAVLLFDFVDVKHRESPEYFSGIVKEMNASFYRQSYGQMWIAGGEVYGWYTTDLHLNQLQVTTWEGVHSGGDTDKLEHVALVKAGKLGVGGRYILAVFAGNVWAWATGHPSKLSVIGENRWGLSGFMHEFGHNLGLPDLYNYANLKAEPVGEWDVMDQGDEELSSYSRFKLGWLPIVNTVSARDMTVLISSLDSPNGTRALKIQLYGSSRWLLAEARRKPGTLDFVIYRIEGSVESGKGSIVLEAVLNPRNTVVFFDKKVNAAFVILGEQADALKVRIAREAEGKKAQEAFDALQSASHSISDAWLDDRLQGLDEAKQELDRAWQSFHNGDFDAAGTSADKAGELAKAAMIPESYSQFQELRPSVEARIQNASAFKSSEAILYVELAKGFLRNADGNFTRNNFDAALDSLLEANRTLTKADEAERAFVESQVAKTETQPILVLAVVVASAAAVVVIFGLWQMTRRKAVPR